MRPVNREIVDELIRLFGNRLNLFRAKVAMAGFKEEHLSGSNDVEVVYYEFAHTLNTYPTDSQKSILGALTKKKNSPVLKRLLSSLESGEETDVTSKPFEADGKFNLPNETHRKQILFFCKKTKIQTLLPKTFDCDKLGSCLLEKEDQPCHLQTGTLCLVAELLRTSQAVNETQGVLNLITILYNEVIDVQDILKSDNNNSGVYDRILDLKNHITNFQDLFAQLKRKYQDPWKPYMRQEAFLKLRSGTLNNSVIDTFMKSLENIRIFLDENNDKPPNDLIHAIQVTQDLHTSFKKFKDSAIQIQFRLQDLIKKRVNGTEEAVKDNLSKLKQRDLNTCLLATLNKLPHNNKDIKDVPLIWPGGDEN